MQQVSRRILGVVAAAGLSIGGSVATAQSLRVETGNSAGLTRLIPQLLAQSPAEKDIELQIKSDEWAQYLDRQGEMNTTIAPGTYDGQVNNDAELHAAAYAMVFAVNESMDDDLAYELTRTYWDSVEGYKQSVAVLRQFPTDEPLAGNNIPLHPSAQRY